MLAEIRTRADNQPVEVRSTIRREGRFVNGVELRDIELLMCGHDCLLVFNLRRFDETRASCDKTILVQKTVDCDLYE